jgi:hypothetical protein
VSGLRQLPNDLVEIGGEGAEDPCHHDVVQFSSIDGRMDDIGEDVVVEGIVTKRQKHEVVTPFVVERGGFQNDRDHRSYILKADNLHVQVRGEAGVGVGASVDGAIIIVVLRDRDPVGSSELLFQMVGDSLLLFPSEDGDPCLLQCLACSSHSGHERLLLSVRGSDSGLSHSRSVVLLPLGSGGLLLIDGEIGGAAQHGRQDGDG